MKLLLSLHISIETSTVSSLFRCNLYCLITFLLASLPSFLFAFKSLLSLHFSIQPLLSLQTLLSPCIEISTFLLLIC